jgi:hypothetical protein
VLAFDQKMWIRIACRSDMAASQEEKDGFMSLAGKVMKIVEVMVTATEDTIAESSKVREAL